MEIPSSGTENTIKALEFNNELRSWKKEYRCFSERVNINEQNKFIASLYENEDLVFRFEYIIMGTYNKEKNIWIWASESQTLDRSLVERINALKDKMRFNKECEHQKHFIDEAYTVIPTDAIKNVLAKFAVAVYTMSSKQNQLLTLLSPKNIDNVDVYVVNRVLFENT